jgi:hypothetical protein
MNDSSRKKPTLPKGTVGAALLSAAMALPGVRVAQAESAPERGQVSFKYLDYREHQPGQDRVTVRAPSVMFLAPLSGAWSVTGTYVYDAISGASPAYHTRQLTPLEDRRRAYDLGLTRYFDGGTLTLGTSYSKESDYLSRGYSLQGSVYADAAKNTTYNFGVAFTDDTIAPGFGGIHEKKRVTDLMVGVTQVLTRRDIAQFNLGYSRGRGYFSDPYKFFDARPDKRNHATLFARWNHHFDATDGISRLSYRYYRNTWAVRSHTFGAEYIQPLGAGWKLTPSLRYYTQTEAKFYLPTDPASVPGPTLPAAWMTEYSEDQRLSAFGAVTYGLKLAKQLDADWLLDIKLEKYKQREKWGLSGNGDAGLAPFDARSIQVGVTRFF